MFAFLKWEALSSCVFVYIYIYIWNNPAQGLICCFLLNKLPNYSLLSSFFTGLLCLSFQQFYEMFFIYVQRLRSNFCCVLNRYIFPSLQVWNAFFAERNAKSKTHSKSAAWYLLFIYLSLRGRKKKSGFGFLTFIIKHFLKLQTLWFHLLLSMPFCNRLTIFYKPSSLPLRNINKFIQSIGKESNYSLQNVYTVGLKYVSVHFLN